MKISPLRMWVQNVLPVVYDDSLSYYEMVAKINEKTNEIITQVNENTDGIEALNKIIKQLGDVDELKVLLEQVEIIINDLYTTDIPAMDSENGSAGVADHAARSDHSHPSDSSKADVSLGIDGALAGQYVKIKTVEAGVPTEFENASPHEVPNGGSAGQIFRKNSNADYDAGWSNEHGIPIGGANEDMLVKNGSDNYAAKWTNTPKLMENFARINTANTAETTYYKNDYLIYNGHLYIVTDTTIAQGVTLNPTPNSGNIKAVSVGEKLKENAHLHWGGNFTGLARADGRMNITLPYQGDFTSVSVNTVNITGEGTSLYGSIDSVSCTFTIQDLTLSTLSKAIYFNLQPSVTLSDYTELRKQAMVFIAQEIIFTLS